ncbi:MAG: helix-turn-helix domain-containing protein [Rhizobiales bacterium]|nr:helix-turn-helix domain-containing protein [Hyphomicrobiales bacterium]
MTARHSRERNLRADVAYSVGFGDASHFSRYYCKAFGETPASSRGGVRELQI